MCVWCQAGGERSQKNAAGENRQVVSGGQIGTGIKSDRERESKGQYKVEAKRDTASKAGRLGTEGESPRNPLTDSLGQEGDSTLEGQSAMERGIKGQRQRRHGRLETRH